MSPVEAEDTGDSEHGEQNHSRNVVHWHHVVIKIKDKDSILGIVVIKCSPAHPWWVSETGADGIHHGLHLKLASKSLVVDHHGWVKLRPIFGVVLHFIV
jgi:hypothetical protein